MQALHFSNHGSINNLQFGHIADPKIEPRYAIIEVLYSSLNHLDLWVLKGWKGLQIDMPHVGGADIVGKIAIIDSHQTGAFKTGQLVCVNPGYVFDNAVDEFILSGNEQLSSQFGIFGETCKGAFARYVKVPIRNIRACDFVTQEQLPALSASLLVGLTSYRMLKSRANIKHADTVLVVGSSGGVNSFTIKLSKLFGATAIALTSSEEKESFSKKIGSDHVINYKKNPNWHKEVREITNGKGVDIVIDNVGQSTFAQSIRCLKNDGKLITVGNTSGQELQIDNRLIFTKQISIIGSTMGSSRDFDAVLSLIKQKQIFSEVSDIIPLSEGIRGYKILESGVQQGKIVFNNQL